jgi:hypothetical protein
MRTKGKVGGFGPFLDANYDGGVVHAYGPSYFQIPRVACFGDSGGPALDATGAVVGVFSGGDVMVTSEEPNEIELTANYAFCARPDAISEYADVVHAAALITKGYAAAGRKPWLAGEGNPLDALKGSGEACGDAAECRSNVCTTGPGGSRCATSCPEGTCPRGLSCEKQDGRKLCVFLEPPTPDAGAGGDDGGTGGGGEAGAPPDGVPDAGADAAGGGSTVTPGASPPAEDEGCRMTAGRSERMTGLPWLVVVALLGLRRRPGVPPGRASA